MSEAKLTPEEIRTIGTLAAGAATGEWSTEMTDAITELARKAAREEVASMAGLVLRRLQEPHPSRSFERNAADDIVRERFSAIFGEVLADFSGQSGQGDAPGE